MTNLGIALAITAAASLSACNDAHVATIGIATASIGEAAAAADVIAIGASVAGGTPPAQALARLDGRMLALRIARSSYDTAQLLRGAGVDPAVGVSRETTDRAVGALRAQLVEMTGR